MSQTLFKIENLTKSYHDKQVLQIPYLEFEEGKIYAILGHNGAGKTTLLNLLGLLDYPDSGNIFFDGRIATKSLELSIRRQITMVMQKPFFFRTSVFKNVAYGLSVRGIKNKEIDVRVHNALHQVGLSDLKYRDAATLSGGEAQRAALARVLVLSPNVLLLDEPTTNIDKKNKKIFEALIKEINEKYNTTIIFTTHIISQSHRLADKIILLTEGKVATCDKNTSEKVC